MTVSLAPRPANEEQRVQAVIKTGLIEAPDNTNFQLRRIIQNRRSQY